MTVTSIMLVYSFFILQCTQTSTAVASILYQLSQHPEKQENLYDEIRTILPSHDSSVTAQRLEKLSYLKACIKETLRYFKALYLLSVTIFAWEFAPVNLPPLGPVILNIYSPNLYKRKM